MRVLRWSLRLLAALLAVLVLLLAGLWWWTGTEGSAQWALQQVAKRQPLVAEGVRGSVRHGLQATRLAWQQDGLQAEARDVELQWQLLPLLNRSLRLDRVRAAQVVVDDKRPPSGEPLKPPASLVLPFRISVDELSIGLFRWQGATPVELRDVLARHVYDGATHQLALRNLRWLDGHYRGEVRLGDRDPFALQAKLQGRIPAPVPGAAQPVPLVFEAQANGTLTAFDVQARLQGEPGGPMASSTRATVTAQVTPFATMPLVRARAQLEAFDTAALWPQAPHTSLSGQLAVQPQGAQAWLVSADLRNALPGPWDRKRVPAERMRLEGDWRMPGRVLVRELQAWVGGGTVQARGQWNGEDAWTVQGTLEGVDPAAVHTAMAAVPVSGRVGLRGEGSAISFNAELAASGRARGRSGNEMDAAIDALELRSLQVRGRWAGDALSLPLLVVRTADARADAALELRPGAQSGRGRIDLEAPGLRVRAVGSLARTQGGGNVRVGASDLAQAQRWLLRLPSMPAAVGSLLLAGRADLQLAWQGGWDDPSVQGTLTLPALQPVVSAGTPVPWAVRDATVRVDGRLADARIEARAQALQGTRELSADISGRGGRRADGAWQAQVGAMQLSARDRALGPGPWRVALRKPVDVAWASGRLDVGASEALLTAPIAGPTPSTATLAWDASRWDGRQLRTAGTVTGLPMGWLELFGGPQLLGSALAGDLVFDARWEAVVGDTLRVQAALQRARGDVSVLAETGDGAATRVQAGVRDARLTLDADGDAVTLGLRWDSERAGTAQGRVVTRLARVGEGWAWPENAPLSGQLRAQLPRLGVWSLLAPPGWRLRGSLAADIAVAGTRDDPDLSGTLRADDLALRSVVDGIALQDGRLRVRLAGRRLLVEEFVLRGAGPSGGVLTGSGEGSWLREGLQVRVAAQLDRLRASARADRELTVSGQMTARLDAAALDLRGALQVDRARIVLPDEAAPQLGSDVVVRNLPPGVSLGPDKAPAGDSKGIGGRSVTMAVELDLGNDFRVQGRGIETRLAGTLTISGESIASPRLTGVIRTLGGEYRAYGQRLDIERGVLRFTGPVDNPALDILAVRPRLTQKVGVQITGTAQAPFVRLYAEPDLPEAEKLAWLVLGRPAAAGGAETALLQSAALALLQSRTGRGGGKGPAALLGLDELGFKREGAEGPAVTLGKRLGRNLYASYERSLSGALGTLYVFYDLSERLTVRAQAGERAAVDLIFTFAYD